MIYKAYVTDALRVLGNLNMRWADLIQDKPVETRSADEIKAAMKEKIRGLSA